MIKSGSRAIKDRKLAGITKFSSNHDSELKCVAGLVDAEAKTAMPCMGRQTHRRRSPTVDAEGREFVVFDPKSLSNGRFLVSRYEGAHVPSKRHKPMLTPMAERGWVFCVRLVHQGTIGFREMLNVLAYNKDMRLRQLSGINNAALSVQSSGLKPKPGADFSTRNLGWRRVEERW